MIRAVRRAARALAMWACAASIASAAAGATPPCIVEPELVPHEAAAGQQVLYRLRILSLEGVERIEWLQQPAFPGLRSELLPGLPDSGRARRHGASYRVREERRALFAERPGALRVAAEGLLCRLAGEDAPRIVRVPPLSLRVLPFPERDRPQGFEGLVGSLSLAVAVSPRAAALGESVRVTVTMRGTGNLWDAAALFAPDDFGGAEVFARPPVLRLIRGERLAVHRRFVYDLVPRSAGSLAVPALRIPYFDPASGSYAFASAAGTNVSVSQRPERSEPIRETAGRVARREDGGWLGRSAGLAAASVALAALALWLAVRALGKRRHRSRALRQAFAAADRARAAGDGAGEAEALARALRSALADRVPDARAATGEELAARGDLPGAAREAVALLAEVERARFDPDAPPADPDAVRAAVRRL